MSKIGHFDALIKAQRISGTVTIYEAGTANLATLWADYAGTIPLANPFSTDAYGRLQFFADGGSYDIKITGPGITTYWQRGVTLALTGPAGPADGILPETYGAVGDGVTDDYAAFLAMFAALKVSTAPRKKIILNPAVYYCIKTRTDATNVFEIDVDNLIMEGPGMGVLTISYEGANAATNFMKFINQPGYNDLHDLQIKCGPGDDANTRLNSKITNIIVWDDTKYTSLSRIELCGCTGAAVTGYNWMSEARHCLFKWCKLGLDEIATTTLVINCYANLGTVVSGSVGFRISTAYGFYAGNACDHADIGYYIENFAVVTMQGNGAEGCNQYMKSLGAILYLDGFAGNNVAGALPDAWIELTGTIGRITGFSNTYNNTYLLKHTNCPNLLIDGMIPKAAITTGDTNPDKYLEPLRLAYDYTDNFYKNIAVADFATEILTTFHNYRGCQNSLATLGSGSVTFTATLKLKNMSGYGMFTFFCNNTPGTALFTFDQATGNGFELENINIPLHFDGNIDPTDKKLRFSQTGSGALFKLTGCQQVNFHNVYLDAITGSGVVFLMDEFSHLVIDKGTMDLMSPLFSGLCTHADWRREAAVRRQIKFTGYSDKPTDGVFDTGCRIEFDAPTAAGYLGCVCTAGGNPGTWKYFGAVEA